MSHHIDTDVEKEIKQSLNELNWQRSQVDVEKEIKQSLDWFDWWITLSEGDIVHFIGTPFSNDRWVRAEVINTLHGHALKPIGLVGNWSLDEICHTVTKQYNIYVNKIFTNELVYRQEVVYKIYEHNPDKWPRQLPKNLLLIDINY